MRIKRKVSRIPTGGHYSSAHHVSVCSQPIFILIFVLSTVFLVLMTLPKSADYADKTLTLANEKAIGQTRVVKGVMVSHGFLKISVDVAYKDKLVEIPQIQSNENNFNETEFREFEKENNEPVPPPKESSSPPSLSRTKSPSLSSSSSSVITPSPILTTQLEVKPIESGEILVELFFHNVQTDSSDSPLSCKFPLNEIHEIVKNIHQIWRNEAKIVIRPRIIDFKASSKMEEAYREHMNRFPTDPITGLAWTTLHTGELGKVHKDLLQVLNIDVSNRNWEHVNIINSYCIGAFVGYNGMTLNRRIFVRSQKYHQVDTEMDVETFSRILAHEIGHILGLRHPSTEICQDKCVNNCNLMCQQRALPSEVDPRFARSLTKEQITRARSYGAMLDVIDSNNNKPPQSHFVGVSTQLLPNYRQVPSQLVFLPIPLATAAGSSARVSRLSFLLSKVKFSPSQVALVAGRILKDTNSEIRISVRVVAAGSFSRRRISSVKRGLPALSFDGFNSDWWTIHRHIEAEVQPPCQLLSKEFLGLFFASSVTLQLRKMDTSSSSQMLYVPKAPSFNMAMLGSSFEVQGERIEGVSPIFNAIYQ